MHLIVCALSFIIFKYSYVHSHWLQPYVMLLSVTARGKAGDTETEWRKTPYQSSFSYETIEKRAGHLSAFFLHIQYTVFLRNLMLMFSFLCHIYYIPQLLRWNSAPPTIFILANIYNSRRVQCPTLHSLDPIHM